jgi:hypothetical protein
VKKLLAVLPAALLLSLPIAPATGADLTPYGREDNALGTLRWLPRNALETAPAGQFRLVVAYDTSLNEAGAAIPLKAKGAFGAKIFHRSHNLTMTNHSAMVQDLKQFSGQTGLPAQVDQNLIAVAGDVRDGTCSKLSNPATFSQAYSTSRFFFHPGQTAYVPVSAGGTCEEVTDSVEVRNPETQELLGFNTAVTNHVPGFWIDVSWPTFASPLGILGQPARSGAEVWYGAAYDSAGDPGPFPNGVDTTGASKSLGAPADTTQTFSFTANPGGTGGACVDTTGGDIGADGSWQDVKIQVPPGSTKVTFRLSPIGDWDLIVINPDDLKKISGNSPPMDETSVAPGTGTPNFPELVPGEYTMRACNFAGETTIFGSVTIEP